MEFYFERWHLVSTVSAYGVPAVSTQKQRDDTTRIPRFSFDGNESAYSDERYDFRAIYVNSKILVDCTSCATF